MFVIQGSVLANAFGGRWDEKKPASGKHGGGSDGLLGALDVSLLVGSDVVHKRKQTLLNTVTNNSFSMM